MSSVSWSEMATWSKCRKLWHWQYERFLEPKVASEPLLIGSCGHEAMVAALRGEDHIRRVYSWVEREIGAGTADPEVLQRIGSVINTVVTRYKQHYDDSNWTLLEVEFPFKIQSGVEGWEISGVFDAFVQDEQGRVWLLEHKFPKTFREEEYLHLDGQVPIYQWAALQIGFPIVGTIYNQIMPRVPATPDILKSGAVSRAKIRSDWPTYKNFVRSQGLDPADYMDMMEKLNDTEWFRRNFIYRGEQEIANFAEDLRLRLVDMTNPNKVIYHNLNGFLCGTCPFSEACIETLKGGDVETLLHLSFKQRRRRTDELSLDSGV